MKKINFLSFLLVITILASAQKVGLTVPSKIDFEGETLFPWVVVSDNQNKGIIEFMWDPTDTDKFLN